MNPTKEDAYYCLLVDALENGDTRTVSGVLEEETEEDKNMHSEDETLLVTTRSGRRSVHEKKLPDHVFY